MSAPPLSRLHGPPCPVNPSSWRAWRLPPPVASSIPDTHSSFLDCCDSPWPGILLALGFCLFLICPAGASRLHSNPSLAPQQSLKAKAKPQACRLCRWFSPSLSFHCSAFKQLSTLPWTPRPLFHLHTCASHVISAGMAFPPPQS